MDEDDDGGQTALPAGSIPYVVGMQPVGLDQPYYLSDGSGSPPATCLDVSRIVLSVMYQTTLSL